MQGIFLSVIKFRASEAPYIYWVLDLISVPSMSMTNAQGITIYETSYEVFSILFTILGFCDEVDLSEKMCVSAVFIYFLKNYQAMSDDEMPPELEDFQTEIKTIHSTNLKKQSHSSEDYTKPNTRHIEDEAKLSEELSKMKVEEKKIEKKVEENKNKQSFGGFKKGFFGGGGSGGQNKPKTQPKPIEVKPTSKKNPLEFKEVQDAMKMNNYLDQTRKEWMTNNFLDSVTNNPKIAKLFSNQEYMRAIDLFKTNPKEAMAKYGQNKEFMEGFQQFCKLMGNQFQGLSQQQKQQNKK